MIIVYGTREYSPLSFNTVHIYVYAPRFIPEASRALIISGTFGILPVSNFE